MNVLVTGANGFVGTAVRERLLSAGHCVIPAVRSARGLPGEVAVGDIGPETDWSRALQGCDSVVHCAARVHVMRESANPVDALAAYRLCNSSGSIELAEQAATSGVKRFVFVSSVKVHGEGIDRPYSEADAPAPQDAYAASKLDAEHGLALVAARTRLEITIVRPCLVYGPGVGGNFLSLLRLIDRGVPLPLGSVANRRSLLYSANLADAIATCLIHPAAVGGTYLVSDREPLATRQLVRAIARELGRATRLVNVPVALLKWAARLTGTIDQVERLTGSLEVDTSAICRELGWLPPFSTEEGLRATVRWYRENYRRSG